jgi:hypothetical protein
MKSTFLHIVLILCLVSCKKEDEEPYGPTIEFVSISHTEVLQFDNQVIIQFSFLDRDGDIGHPDPDLPTLRVRDQRLSADDWYHIPPVTPDLQSLRVEGKLSVQLSALFLLGNGNQEMTRFQLQLIDRSGNWSNEIETPQVMIKKNP